MEKIFQVLWIDSLINSTEQKLTHLLEQAQRLHHRKKTAGYYLKCIDSITDGFLL